MASGLLKPNFFIIGAPRSGTTALFEYLKSHPDILCSCPKEPNFFNTDLNLPRDQRMCTVEDYINICFPRLRQRLWKTAGEGSVLYLFSKKAVPEILRYNPEAKFIVLLRSPLATAPSYYLLYRFLGTEDAPDFEKAWRLQDARRNGLFIPDMPDWIREPRVLQYGDIFQLGKQMQRFYQLISQERALIIMWDYFRQNPKEVYEKVLRFLGVPSDGRSDFPAINRSRMWKANFIAPLLCRKFFEPLFWRKPLPLVQKTKEKLGIKRRFNILPRVKDLLGPAAYSLLVKHAPSAKIRDEFRNELRKYFRNDILLLEETLMQKTPRHLLLGDGDISHWLR